MAVRLPDGGFRMHSASGVRDYTLLEAVSFAAPRAVLMCVIEKAIGLEHQEIAELAGVTTQSIRNWKGRADCERAEALEDLRALVEFLVAEGEIEPARIGGWLCIANSQLDDQRPLDALQAGEFHRVLELAKNVYTVRLQFKAK